MGYIESYFGPEIESCWNSAKKSMRQSSWSVLVVAGLISGGCYDAALANNRYQSGDIELATLKAFRTVSEFTLALGIAKSLDLSDGKKIIIEQESQLKDEQATELLASQTLYLPENEPFPLSAA